MRNTMLFDVKRAIAFSIAVLAAALLLAPAASRSEGAAISVAVDAPAGDIEVGTEFEVRVVARDIGGIGLGGLSFDLLYDPTIIGATLIEPTEAVREMSPIMNEITELDKGEARARFVRIMIPLQGSGPTGDVALAIVKFKALKGGDSRLELQNVELLDAEGDPLFHWRPNIPEIPTGELVQGSVTVVGSSGAGLGVIIPGVAVGAVVIVAIAVGGMRFVSGRKKTGR